MSTTYPHKRQTPSDGWRYLLAAWLLLAMLAPLYSQQPDTAFARNCLETAEKYARERKFERAVSLSGMALNIYLEYQPPFYERAVYITGQMGRYYRNMGAFDSCYTYYQRSIKMGQQYLSPTDTSLLKSMNGLGIYHYYLGNCEQALTYYNEVLERRMQKYGPDHEEVANAYNNIAVCYDQLGKHLEATEYYQKSLAIRQQTKGAEDPLVADGYLNLGNSFHYLGDYGAALEVYQKALAIYLANSKDHRLDLTQVYNNMGVCYQTKGDYAEALELLKKSLRLYEEELGPDDPEVANALNNLGINYYYQGDYDKALVYFQKALSIRRKHFEESHPLVASVYNHIGNCYRKKKEYSQALAYCRRAMQLRKERFGPNHKEVADSYKDLGKYFREVNDLAQAIFYFQQALAIDRTQLGDDHPIVGDDLELIGHAFLSQGKFEQASSYFKQALDIKVESLGARHPEVASLWTALAQCLPDDPGRALGMLSKALDILELDICEADPMAAVTNPLPFLEALQTRGEIELDLYFERQVIDWLVKADETFTIALQIIDALRQSFQEPESKQLLLDAYYRIFERSIEVKYQFYLQYKELEYLEDAFTIAEHSKNVLLLDAVQKSQADRFSGIPADLLEREQKLRRKLAYLEQQRFDEEQKGMEADPKRIRDYRQELFELKRSFYRLMDTLTVDFPDYYALRYGRPDIDLTAFQQNTLGAGRTLLAYFVGEQHLYLFVVSSQSADLVRVRRDFPLNEWVASFREAIDHYDPLLVSGPEAIRVYTSLSDSLYKHLLDPVESLLSDTTLIIVPDGVLGYLPFECIGPSAKATEKGWKDLSFLIHRYRISYAYGINLLDQTVRRPKRRLRGLLALAPGFSVEQTSLRYREGLPSTLNPLYYNEEEAMRIQELIEGDVFVGQEATEALFRELGPKYRLLHLATHAQASDSTGAYSFLAFAPLVDSLENEFLFVRDLYNMELHADMVVLSACETGIGEWQRGEGIISLGRGFLYAGARSIITTLWQVDDEPTARIMELFYQNLKLGLTKDEALRKAKLAYLEESSSLRAHPLYWASFVPVGDMAPVEWDSSSRRYSAYWWLLVPGVLLIGLFFWKGPFQKIG